MGGVDADYPGEGLEQAIKTCSWAQAHRPHRVCRNTNRIQWRVISGLVTHVLLQPDSCPSQCRRTKARMHCDCSPGDATLDETANVTVC